MPVSGFLKIMMKAKKEQLAINKARFPLPLLRRDAEQTPARADFYTAMTQSSFQDPGIIAEIKKASPSKGNIKIDLSPAIYVKLYTKGGARAVSVLTEPLYFKGSLKDLEIVSSETDLPVLRKDFIISEYQIFEAKKAGASSVLLITSLLAKNQQSEFTSLIRELDMEPLVEINSEFELEQAIITGARIININNRNLSTLETDLNIATKIIPFFPKNIVPVAASGISNRSDIIKGLDAGIYNFLVGETIVRANDPQAFIQYLRGQPCNQAH